MSISESRFLGGPMCLAVVATMVTASSLVAQDQRGWLGVTMHCPDPGCTIEDRSGLVVWSFGRAPLLTRVRDDGPAGLAGIRAGDVIIAIDDVAITSDEGGRRFAALQAGVPVTLVVMRAGRRYSYQVMPRTHREVFSDQVHRLLAHTDWEGLIGRVKELYRERQSLEQVLRTTEQTLYQTQTAGRQRVSEMDPELLRVRVRIDSIRQEMLHAQNELRTVTDSLAVRTLYVPETRQLGYVAAPEVAVVVPEPSAPTQVTVLTTYGSNAVAGARFEEISEGLANYFQGVREGLLVLKVVEGTPAYDAGLRDGDVVVSVNGARVSKIAHLRKALREASEAKLVYVRKGNKESCKIASK